MAINWGFEEVENEFVELPQGMYRCRIKTAEETTSTGKPMISLMLDISGHNQNYSTTLFLMHLIHQSETRNYSLFMTVLAFLEGIWKQVSGSAKSVH